MPSKIKTLEDGFRITEVVCDKCGTNHTITHEDVTFVYCSCGNKLMNIAYYRYNEKGVLDFNEYYWKEKERRK